VFDLSAIDFDAMLPEEQDELLQVIRAQEFAEQAAYRSMIL
jgi:hypothetical protein